MIWVNWSNNPTLPLQTSLTSQTYSIVTKIKLCQRCSGFDVQQHIPNPTFSMMMLSNCSLRSAMMALWDWRVWSDAAFLLSRSHLTSSRDVTSVSSRHTASSRCSCCVCHCKQPSSLHFVERKKRQHFPNLLKHVSACCFFSFLFHTLSLRNRTLGGQINHVHSLGNIHC